MRMLAPGCGSGRARRHSRPSMPQGSCLNDGAAATLLHGFRRGLCHEKLPFQDRVEEPVKFCFVHFKEGLGPEDAGIKVFLLRRRNCMSRPQPWASWCVAWKNGWGSFDPHWLTTCSTGPDARSCRAWQPFATGSSTRPRSTALPDPSAGPSARRRFIHASTASM